MRKEDMVESTKNKGTAYIKYEHKKTHSQYHHFFEGDDDLCFYCQKIKDFRFIKTKSSCFVNSYPCGGKQNVIDIYKKIFKESPEDLREKEILFFIDKDFDDELSLDSYCYITPCYSIENFYFENESLQNILEYGLEINALSDFDVSHILRKITKERDDFLEEISILNSWYKLQKIKSKENSYPDLKNLKDLKDIASKNSGKIPQTIEELEKLTPNFIKIEKYELDAENKKCSNNRLEVSRGKYLEQFFSKKLKEVFEAANNPPNEYFSQKFKNSYGNMSKDSLIKTFAPCIQSPKCLIKFLEKNLKGLN